MRAGGSPAERGRTILTNSASVRSLRGMKMRVTFDSNSWQRVVRPASFPKDPRQPSFQAINSVLQDGRLHGFICETVGTLEAVRRDARGTYFAGGRAKVDFVEKETDAGRIHVQVSMGPDHSKHPGLPGILSDMLQEAFELGFRLLSAPRIGTPRPSDFLTAGGNLREEIFAANGTDEEFHDRLERFGKVLRALEARGVGKAAGESVAAAIQTRLGGASRPWFEYLDKAKDQAEEKAMQNAIAEWADGDAVAAHIAYDNDVFCTEDAGKSAGVSILDANNRAWLSSTYGVSFASLSELAERL